MTVTNTSGSDERTPNDHRPARRPTPVTVFELLANERRIRALSYLSDHPGPVAVEALGAAVAAAERRTDADGGPDPGTGPRGRETRTPGANGVRRGRGLDEQVSLELRHVHLPKLETAGVIAYRAGDGTVELRTPTAHLAPYLDLAAGRPAREQ